MVLLSACAQTVEQRLADRWSPSGAVRPMETVYCYVTIADGDCYAAPQAGQEARLIRAHPPMAVVRPAAPDAGASGAL
ncbi:MAG: hypothetical protein HOK81_13300 [Rhodospirillaceae bacterium]|nr:hypothetical protein [Rhodospirillaceae bacterium]